MANISRRHLLTHGSAALAGLAFLHSPWLVQAFPMRPGEEVIPWLDQPPENPIPDVVSNQLKWQQFDSWITPNDEFFSVAHYGRPAIDEQNWRLEITGLVQRPMTLTLRELRARPRREIDFTLECSGNHGFPWFVGGIGNAKWTGTPLAPILQEAGVQQDGIEVAFFGTDAGEEEVRDIKLKEHFARSMSLQDAMNPHNLLCYEMNGAPLPQANGFPLRLIAPGWYGIANVKWLERIEVMPTRYMGRFMARDYVSIRKEKQNGDMGWTFTSVGRALLKSVPARVTRHDGQYRIMGAAWGAPIQRVEVRIDDGPWKSARLDREQGNDFTWKVWHLDWQPAAGAHTVTSRAIDTEGNVQPSQADPRIAQKYTYWESNGQIARRIRIPKA